VKAATRPCLILVEGSTRLPHCPPLLLALFQTEDIPPRRDRGAWLFPLSRSRGASSFSRASRPRSRPHRAPPPPPPPPRPPQPAGGPSPVAAPRRHPSHRPHVRQVCPGRCARRPSLSLAHNASAAADAHASLVLKSLIPWTMALDRRQQSGRKEAPGNSSPSTVRERLCAPAREGTSPAPPRRPSPPSPPSLPPSVTAEAVYRGTDGAQRALHVSGLRTPLGVCACPCGLVPVARLRAWEGGGELGEGGGRRRWSPRFGGRASVGTPVFTRHVPRRGPPHVLPSRRRHPPPTLSRSLRSVRVPLGVCSGGVKGGGRTLPLSLGPLGCRKWSGVRA